MSKVPPTYFVKSDGKHEYICTQDNVGYAIYWLKDRDYVWSRDGQDKLGYLKFYPHRDGNWWEVLVGGQTVAYVQK